MSVTPKVNWSIVEECLDEAEFLWSARERALDAHDQDVKHMETWTEERLLGSLDGIATAGDAVVELLTTAAQQGPPARVSVAAYMLATLNSPFGAESLVRLLTESAESVAIRKGLELAASDIFQQRLQSLAGGSLPVLALPTDVRAFQGVDAQDKIPALWATADDDVRAAAVRLARNSPKQVASSVAMTALQIENPEIRVAGMELGLLGGMREGWTTALDIVGNRQPGFERAAIALAMLGGPEAIERLAPAFALEDLRRESLFAAGFSGTVVAADACLAAMRSGILPKVAGESFCAITGLDLDKERMVVPEPPLPDEPVPFAGEDLDADLVPDADEALPMPDVPAVERWWMANRQRFPVGERFVAGRPWSLPTLHDRLAHGPMRRRHGWAFEVAVRTAGEHQIQTRAFMATQRRQIAGLGQKLPLIKSRKDSWTRH